MSFLCGAQAWVLHKHGSCTSLVVKQSQCGAQASVAQAYMVYKPGIQKYCLNNLHQSLDSALIPYHISQIH